MTDLLISPAERPPITTMGTVSSLCERLGCDILWESSHGLVGVQRKATMDLIASVRDGRLGRELQEMQTNLTHAFLIIEGSMVFTPDGEFNNPHTRWTRRQQWGVELSIQRHNVNLLYTRSVAETVACIEYLVTWAEKSDHVSSLLSSGPNKTNGWGKATDRLFAVHVMSRWPGISTVLAERIFDLYGRIPCRHDLVEQPLTLVHGIGKERAGKLVRIL